MSRTEHARRSRAARRAATYRKLTSVPFSYGSNPPRRRRHYASNPPRRRRHYRHNPDGRLTGFLWDATYVTGGFIGTRLASGFVLPMIGIQQPLFRIVSEGVIAWGVGMLGGMMLGRSAGNLITVGGLVAALDDAVKTYVAPFVPALAGNDMTDISAYYQPQVGAYYNPSLSAELPSDNVAI